MGYNNISCSFKPFVIATNDWLFLICSREIWFTSSPSLLPVYLSAKYSYMCVTLSIPCIFKNCNLCVRKHASFYTTLHWPAEIHQCENIWIPQWTFSALFKKVYILISNLVFIYLWGKSALITAKQQKWTLFYVLTEERVTPPLNSQFSPLWLGLK